MSSMKSEVVVIGGGVAGISAALELSKTHDVTIIEKKHLFNGSSGRNPGRMGHGFHYIDFETAKLYLEASIQVQRTYPHFLIGEHLPFSHPIRHGRYFVTKTSLYSFAEVLETYQKLQQRYAELVAEDPENKVFGEPESFFRILEPFEYQDHVNADIIEGAVETCEHLFNWQAFSLHIRDIIRANSRINLLENSEVLDLTHYDEFGTRFKVMVKTGHGKLFELQTNYIVNSAWENIEQLNDKLGITYIDGQRTNRLKCLVEVKLPSSLLAVNSSFFCMGSFCMFSNMGDGRAMMTLADVTNMEVSSAKSISVEMARYVNGEISREEKMRIGEEIKVGVAAYIPQMNQAEVLDVKFGIVQTKGELSLKDLYHREGAHHVRNYHHIREEMQGLIANPAMKLFYFVQNGIRVREIFDMQLARDLMIKETLNTIKSSCTTNLFWGCGYFQKEIYRAIAIQIDKMSNVYPQLAVQLMTFMEQKKQLNEELLKFFLSQKFLLNLSGASRSTSPFLVQDQSSATEEKTATLTLSDQMMSLVEPNDEHFKFVTSQQLGLNSHDVSRAPSPFVVQGQSQASNTPLSEGRKSTSPSFSQNQLLEDTIAKEQFLHLMKSLFTSSYPASFGLDNPQSPTTNKPVPSQANLQGNNQITRAISEASLAMGIR